jgi:hypothetical protein
LLTFETAEGAATYLRWFREQAGEEIVTARPVPMTDVPDGAVVLFHEPDGCCRRDLPVYLAAWQRGATIFSVHAGGRRRNDRAIAQLTTAFDLAVPSS